MLSPVEQTTESVSTLLGRLQTQKTKTFTILSLMEVDAVEYTSEYEPEESRIFDLISVARISRMTYRKGLSRRSLALKFEKWEIANSGTSRVTELLNGLLNDLEQKQISRDDNLSLYLSEAQRGFTNKDVAEKDIRHGIKLLLFEALREAVSTNRPVSYTQLHLH